MTNQEIFDSLSELEQALFYKSRNPGELAPLQRSLYGIHAEVRDLLLEWHTLTGCVNKAAK